MIEDRNGMGKSRELKDKLLRIVFPSHVLKFLSSYLLIFCLIFVSLSGCGPKKTVYIPPEWRTPPSQRQEEAAVHSVPFPKQESPPSLQPHSPLLKPPPAIKESDVSVMPEVEPVQDAKKGQTSQAPEYLASMHVVEQAKASLAQGQPDAAISLLEKAIQVDVYNGEAFFGLARAWHMKGSRQKALEFARKAEILFQHDHTRLKDVYLFEADLHKEIGDDKNMELCRQKASKL